MKFRSMLRGLVVPVCAVVGLAVVGAPSVATPVATEQHCVANIETGVAKCYSTKAEADRFGTGERLPLLSLVAFYDGFNKTGDSYTFQGSHECTASTSEPEYSHPDMSRFGWNDRVSSVVTAHKCDVWFSSDIGYEGECGNRWIDSQMDLRLDSCNNRASSYDVS